MVYRWAYDYSVPGAAQDFIPQNQPPATPGRSGSCAVSAIVLFMAVIAVIVGWWLSQQRLTAKPWLEEGSIGDFPGTGAMTWPAAKIGLGVFLAVAGLVVRTLHQRLLHAHEHGGLAHDARAWAAVVQHGVLVVSSVALQWAYVAARRDDMEDVIIGLCAGGHPPLHSWLGNCWRGNS